MTPTIASGTILPRGAGICPLHCRRNKASEHSKYSTRQAVVDSKIMKVKDAHHGFLVVHQNQYAHQAAREQQREYRCEARRVLREYARKNAVFRHDVGQLSLQQDPAVERAEAADGGEHGQDLAGGRAPKMGRQVDEGRVRGCERCRRDQQQHRRACHDADQSRQHRADAALRAEWCGPDRAPCWPEWWPTRGRAARTASAWRRRSCRSPKAGSRRPRSPSPRVPTTGPMPTIASSGSSLSTVVTPCTQPDALMP